MRTRIKICGVSSAEIAEHVCQSGADAVGLMFYPSSKRFINIEQARAVCHSISPFVSSVGVFVNPDAHYVNELIDILNLDYVQFHGDEDAEFCRSFSVPYIKALRVGNSSNLLNKERRFADAEAILLDTDTEVGYGGTGKVFNWKKCHYGGNKPVILAGGLSSENVSEAIQMASPYGVDVSSGVEKNDKKDKALISAFCQKVHGIY